MGKTSSMVPMQNWPLLKRLCVRESGPGSRGQSTGIMIAATPLPVIWCMLHGMQDPLMREATSRTPFRSEEHTSELQSLMRISYAVFCLQTKKTQPGAAQYNDSQIRQVRVKNT